LLTYGWTATWDGSTSMRPRPLPQSGLQASAYLGRSYPTGSEPSHGSRMGSVTRPFNFFSAVPQPFSGNPRQTDLLVRYP
jgi:hypothetical protein